MIYTLFFSRMRELDGEGRAEYDERATALRDLVARDFPGFEDIKTYAAEDGERLTVVRFRDRASQQAWKRNEAHREAQARGRSHYYDRYRIVICEELRERRWGRNGSGPTDANVGAS